jgi:hypothetical protein
MIFTASVRNILDTPSYVSSTADVVLWDATRHILIVRYWMFEKVYFLHVLVRWECDWGLKFRKEPYCIQFTHTMLFPCRSDAVPLPCHAAPLSLTVSAVSFAKVRVVVGNIRTAIPTVLTDWYASDNNLRGTPRGRRKNPNAGRSPTCRLWTADANWHMSCHVHAAPIPRCAVALRSRL